MIKIGVTEVVGWEHAIRGMRNPLESWEKSDSYFMDDTGDAYNILGDGFPWPDEMYVDYVVVGDKDLELMKKLASAGRDHAKFRRMLVVYADITAPLYWWKEFDTYKVGTVANSCSTMHKIHSRDLSLNDFSCEHLYSDELEHLKSTIELINADRKLYLDGKRKEDWWQLIQLLPSSYMQLRTVMMSYEVLSNIYRSRQNHKLDEWVGFCKWIETLPHSEVITGVRSAESNG